CASCLLDLFAAPYCDEDEAAAALGPDEGTFSSGRCGECDAEPAATGSLHIGVGSWRGFAVKCISLRAPLLPPVACLFEAEASWSPGLMLRRPAGESPAARLCG